MKACDHGWRFTGFGDWVLIAGGLSGQKATTGPGVPRVPKCGPPERSNADEGALRVIPINRHQFTRQRRTKRTAQCTAMHGASASRNAGN